MKSGAIPVSIIALQISVNSFLLPIHNLNPTGLPSDNLRNCSTKCIKPKASLKVLCAGGDITVVPATTFLISAISGVFLAAGKIPPWPGFAPCESLISIILT
ncbi:hypothetical protein D3C87_1430920 [compost metagenome]